MTNVDPCYFAIVVIGDVVVVVVVGCVCVCVKFTDLSYVPMLILSFLPIALAVILS